MINPRYRSKYNELKDAGVYNPVAYLQKQFGNDILVDIPCGKCEACLVRRANEWTFRLREELKVSSNCFFITLTYDEENLPKTDIKVRSKNAFENYLNGGKFYDVYLKDVPTFNKKHCQLFIKKLRNHYGNGLRYFLASEYGTKNERPHYHMLLFNVPERAKNDVLTLLKLESIVKRSWNMGRIEVTPVINERVVYCSKYSLSNLDNPYYYPKPFILASRRPMIGYNFLKKNLVEDYRYTLKNYGVAVDGTKYPLSRVYKYKIFDADMRAEIYEKQLEDCKEITEDQRKAYKLRIRKQFKKSRVL